MNKWFEETFLPSLFERAGTCKPMWLSQKQTAVCTRNMEVHTCDVQYSPVDYYRHDDYHCTWRGRQVWLYYSSKNGCGRIEFFLNDEDRAENAARDAKLRREGRAELLQRLRRGETVCMREINFKVVPTLSGDLDALLESSQEYLAHLRETVAKLQSWQDEGEIRPSELETLAEYKSEIPEIEEEIAAMMEYKARKQG